MNRPRPHARPLVLAAAVLAPILLAACGAKKDKTLPVQTAAVDRRTIVVDAQANGTVEPINVVEVKSKASGLITRMTVETGTLVKPGDLLVQVDTRDVQNQFNQADASYRAALARQAVSQSQLKRSDDMFKARVITQQEHEAASLDYENAKAAVVSAAANLDLAKQRLEDATVSAPVAGTVIEKDVSLGQVITSATGAFGGGTTLLKMADLNTVRIRAFFNETDIGQVRSGQMATVIVDAYPDRRFLGTVEKIEPQAVIQQNVTMFPVLVTLDNREGFLKPGMNGEASVLVEQLADVIAVPNDALKNIREAASVAQQLGLNSDSVQAEVRTQFASMGGMGGMGGGQRPATGDRGAATTTSRGDVELSAQGPQGPQMPDVSDKDCAAVKGALARKPDVQKKIDALREQMRSGAIDRAAAVPQMQQLYAAAGVDARVAGACRRKEQGGTANGVSQSGEAVATQQPGAGRGRAGVAITGALQPSSGDMPMARRSRPGLVFVAEGAKEKRSFHPRVVMLGAGNFDYTQVLSGLKPGEEVVLLASLALQAQRQQQNDRFRGMGGIPGMQNNQTPAAGGARGGAAGGAAGGAPRGGAR